MRNLLLMSVAGAALVFTAAVSNAAPLQIDVLLNGVSISGGPQTYSSGLASSYSFSGGGFDVSGTATGDPFTISPNFSNSTTSIKTLGNAGTIEVRITDYNLPTFVGNVRNTLGINTLNATTLISGQVSNYFDSTNTAFGTQTLLATLASSPNSSASNGGGVTVAEAMQGPFSETTIYTFTFSGGGQADQVSANAQIRNVPEPMSLALLGSGLAALGLVRRKRT